MQEYEISVIINDDVVFTTKAHAQNLADVFALISAQYDLHKFKKGEKISIEANPI